ncbi:MAG: tripartite tricarboxylate transporter substrate binding protein [Desulfitobacterium hafniense]|nr:tripartite tricarboxylate transporter substrate binding protein [Desulfitobacterium hafniense]
MRKYSHLITYLLVIALIGLLVTGCGSKENVASANAPDKKKAVAFPEKPINFWIPYDAGGGSDIIGRALVEAAQKNLDKPIVIVNKPGTSGAVGLKELYNAKNDGYTLLTNTTTIVTHKLLGTIPYNHHDYEPIITFNYEPGSIAVPANSPYKDIKEFIDYAKKNKVKIATSAKGGIWNIATQAFIKQAGINADVVVEGGGGAKAVVMAAGGHVDAVVASPLEMFTQLKSGNLRLLSVFGPERVDAFSNVPTFKEAGYDLSITTTRPLLAPKGTPKEVLDVLYKAFKTAAEDPKYIKTIKDMGAMPLLLGPEETIKFFDKEEKVMEKILKESGQI